MKDWEIKRGMKELGYGEGREEVKRCLSGYILKKKKWRKEEEIKAEGRPENMTEMTEQKGV